MSVQCECRDWPRLQGMLTEHHENCPKCDIRGDALKQITNLVRGVEAWAADEDGVHPDCWQAYRRAKLSIGEFIDEPMEEEFMETYKDELEND